MHEAGLGRCRESLSKHRVHRGYGLLCGPAEREGMLPIARRRAATSRTRKTGRGEEHVRERRGGLHPAWLRVLPPGDRVSVSQRREIHREEHRRERPVRAGAYRARLAGDADDRNRWRGHHRLRPDGIEREAGNLREAKSFGRGTFVSLPSPGSVGCAVRRGFSERAPPSGWRRASCSGIRPSRTRVASSCPRRTSLPSP